MGGNQNGGPVCSAGVQQPQNCFFRGSIHFGRRLVADNDCGGGRESDAEGDARRLTPRKLCWPGSRPMRKSNQLKQFGGGRPLPIQPLR